MDCVTPVAIAVRARPVPALTPDVTPEVTPDARLEARCVPAFTFLVPMALPAMLDPAAYAEAGVVSVCVHRATNLRAADRNGLSDPYVRVRVGEMVERSEVVPKTLNPTFDWTFTFRYADVHAAARQAVEVQAFDFDSNSRTCLRSNHHFANG